MPEQIYVLIDHTDGRIRNTSLEALACAQQLGSETGREVSGLILGQEIGGLAEQLSRFRMARVIAVEAAPLAEYRPETYVAALFQILSQDRPQFVLLAHSYQNLDLAPRLAARLKTALVSECIGYRVEEGTPVFTRQMFRGKLHADTRVKSTAPCLISLQAGAFQADQAQPGTAALHPRSVDLNGVPLVRELLERVGATQDAVDLSKAEIIIGVGRGIKKEENLAAIRELAQLLGAEIGASRPVVDNDWLERNRQIGSSGQSVSPKLYLALGISGAIQHVVGIKNSGCIVAVNTDPNAPIFNLAHYGIVGDLNEFVPALTRKLREIR